ncbi:MAG: STAS domain-containing protein [Planctomycetes bacterium]|nr:STAS domain-containing protein [Planctomycetota bacterium]
MALNALTPHPELGARLENECEKHPPVVIRGTCFSPVLVLDGDLVFEGIVEFSHKLNGILSESTKHVILDMGATRYISARAIGIIASTVRCLRERKKDLKLVNVSEPIQHLFKITGLSRTVGIYRDEHSMRASLGPQVGILEKQSLW